MTTRRSRRDFLKASPARRRGADHPARTDADAADVSPNERIRIAAIGIGIRGQQDVRAGAAHARRRARRGRRRLRRPAHAGEGALGRPGVHDARLPRSARAARRRRGRHRDAGSLARADGGRRDEGGQGRLRREADGAGARRGPLRDRRGAADGPDSAGRQPARQLHRLREGERAVPRRRDRRAESRRSVDQPQLLDRRVAVFHSARRVAADHRLGSVSSAARRSGRSSRCACSAGATTATTAPAFPATCSCTCSPASTSCSTRSDPRARSRAAGCGTGTTAATFPT